MSEGLLLYTGKDLKKLDQLAIKHLNISGYEFMCKAGQAAFAALQNRWHHAKQILVMCGPGNNGGDGFVLARLAKKAGYDVKVYLIGAQQNCPAEAKQAREDWLALGGEIHSFQGTLGKADVIVDALLGIGTRLPLASDFQTAIGAINNSACPVMSIDIPSGLDSDTGAFEQVIHATLTITFVALKIGMLTGGAVDVVGELLYDNLGIDTSLFSEIKPIAARIVYQDILSYLPKRSLSSHKGENGHVCIIGGGHSGFSGAVCLAGEAALRAGAGLVSAVVATSSLPLLARAPSELLCYGFCRPKEMRFILDVATVLVLGPGLSQNSWGKKFFKETLQHSNKPCIVDADGLNWLADFPQQRENWILTPHPKEAARLLGITTAKVQENRIKAAVALKEKFGGVIVLKGAGTIVVLENGKIMLNVGGFPALSTGGTGDVLAGLIAGLVGQKLSLSQAACLAVSVHAQAACLEQTLGERGMLASDLFLHIRNLVNNQGYNVATNTFN